VQVEVDRHHPQPPPQLPQEATEHDCAEYVHDNIPSLHVLT